MNAGFPDLGSGRWKKVHGVILCCFDMRLKMSCIPSQDSAGYFGNISRIIVLASPISFALPLELPSLLPAPAIGIRKR